VAIRINRNEPVAARRRVAFYCVDAADATTPETGEAGGQPQVSVDGGAWSNTGIGVLVAIGVGSYYAELTQAITNVADAVIRSRYKSVNTIEFPGDTVVIDSRLEAAYAVSLTGSGEITWPYTLTDLNNGDPIVGATVWVTSDIAGAVTLGVGLTNAAGQIAFRLAAGTVYVWWTHPDYSADNLPDTEVVSA
jgi:hypothetical protein